MCDIPTVIILTLGALLVSYVLNKIMLKVIREKAVTFGAPITEELIKTLPAYFLNRPIWHVHFLFGIGEALYDLFTGNRESGKWAALLSIVSHSIFGGMVYFINVLSDSIALALLCAIIAHIGWNYLIMHTGKNKQD